MKPTLIFDYDGTLHNTIVIYESAFRKTYVWLVENGYAEKSNISREEITGWLGMNSQEMWNSFLPDLPQEVKQEAAQRVGNDMIRQIREHRAVWYPGAQEAMDKLSHAGYCKIVLSNCRVGYRKAHWQEFSMDRWFAAFYDCESFGFAPKTEIIKEIEKQYPGPYIVIGDRIKDLQCARASDSPFIGCKYGFGEEGELEGADGYAETVHQLPQRVDEICRQKYL